MQRANGSRYAPSGVLVDGIGHHPGALPGRDYAILMEPTPSHANFLKTRRLPPLWSRNSPEGRVHAVLGRFTLFRADLKMKIDTPLYFFRVPWQVLYSSYEPTHVIIILLRVLEAELLGHNFCHTTEKTICCK